MNPFGTGADASPYDNRTYKHDSTLSMLLTTGGIHYDPADIDNQHSEGICTAISLTQNAGKALGRKFSPDFQYLLQKKYFDMGWYEGSSIFAALKMATKYGFLPIELFPYITEADRSLPYAEYAAKLAMIPESEIQRLIGLCTNKLAGYAQLQTDAASLAKGILDSKSGILCRYVVGEEWYTPSWLPKDIDPLRPPQKVISGHAIAQSFFDFTNKQIFELPNTWGTQWNDNGKGHTVYSDYRCTEAWIPYYDTVPAPLPNQFIFTKDMKYGETSEDVRQLQLRLISLGYDIVSATAYYGNQTRKAVLKFQLDKMIPLSLYERYILAGSSCGYKTRAALNAS